MNENEIQVWNYESSEIRTVQVNGEPWFVLADVCKVLELSSPHKVADRLENDERNQIPVTDSLGRYQNTAIINESGLHCDSPERQTAGKTISEMGDIGSASIHPETRSVHDRSGTGKSTDKP